MENFPQVAALQNMFNLILYGTIGFLGPSIMMFHNLDALQDQFTATVDSVDTYDFIVGKYKFAPWKWSSISKVNAYVAQKYEIETALYVVLK